MVRDLELLAPARDISIGIAAIDCGADAVYIAGPGFGARQAAGNSVEDIASLCSYAHRFGARIFVTFNTILYESELKDAERLFHGLEDAGTDAFIVQDLAVLDFHPRVPLHASTQCSIRTPDQARFYEGLGFSRLVLERELSLAQMTAIRRAVSSELECFVHGALCVCYSGQCYMSEEVARRSANRGACVQACRALYDLQDASGRTILRNKAVLSLKDLNLCDRLTDLARAGMTSFKIEGRLKNGSYVKNVVRKYSLALDSLVAAEPDRYRRASFGKVTGGFTPMADKTFNRGYTTLFLDGKKRNVSSMDAPKSMGERLGKVLSVKQLSSGGKPSGIEVAVDTEAVLHNGDGFSFVDKDGIFGFRGDICSGNRITCKAVPGLRKGTELFRNTDASFEKELETGMPERLLAVDVAIKTDGMTVSARAVSEDGRIAVITTPTDFAPARDESRMKDTIRRQIGKKSGHYCFRLKEMDFSGDVVPFLGTAFLNGIRRSLAAELDKSPCNCSPLLSPDTPCSSAAPAGTISYKSNVSNSLARKRYMDLGAETVEDAFELSHREEVELMRSRYCVRRELGLCPGQGKEKGPAEPLFLVNNGRRFRLDFDCPLCEMTVSNAPGYGR